MAGRKDGKIYIGPHLLGRFVINRREAVDVFFGKRKQRTKEMRLGIDWHEKLGYTNEEMFEKEFELEGERIVLRGVPDYIDDDTVEELKTVGGKYVGDRYLEGARVQMLAYLFLTGRPNGRVVVVDRNTGEVVEEFRVFRDDEELMGIIRSFIREVKKREEGAGVLMRYLSSRGRTGS